MGVCFWVYFNVFTPTHAFGFDSLRSKWNAPINFLSWAGWTAVKDQNSGYYYYWNSVTNEVTWDRPPGFEEPSNTAALAPSIATTSQEDKPRDSSSPSPHVVGSLLPAYLDVPSDDEDEPQVSFAASSSKVESRGSTRSSKPGTLPSWAGKTVSTETYVAPTTSSVFAAVEQQKAAPVPQGKWGFLSGPSASTSTVKEEGEDGCADGEQRPETEANPKKKSVPQGEKLKELETFLERLEAIGVPAPVKSK
jgi:hypothetical protein